MGHEGARAGVDDIMVTSGGQQAIDLSIRTFVNPGDTILAEGPTYPGAVPCFTTYEARVEQIPMDDDGLRIDLVEEALARLAAEGRPPKLLYTIPNFHNPGGVTMSLERRERLIELAHERELLIVEDNPYGQIRFEGDPLPTPVGARRRRRLGHLPSTFSKILAPGVRVGWVAAPAAVLRKMNLGKQAADLCSSTHLAARRSSSTCAATTGATTSRALNGIYRSRRDAMLRALEEELPPEATWSRPSGGLFVWATLPDYLDTTHLLALAIDKHEVAFVPGRGAFLDGRGGNSMRLNYSGVPEPMHQRGRAPHRRGRRGDDRAAPGPRRRTVTCMRVAVLKGGRSLEREVSLRSGANAEAALRRLGHDVIEIDVDQHLVRTLRAERPEVAFIALHGKGGEDGTVQELLEILEIPYTGPGALACERAMDKVVAKAYFAVGGHRHARRPTPSARRPSASSAPARRSRRSASASGCRWW